MSRRSPAVDAIHAALDPRTRGALEAIRRAVHAAAPGAEECLSYGMPAVRLEGRPLVAWRAAARHCAFHPLSGRTVAEFAHLLGDYDTGPGTIRFAPDRVLPASLVRRLVEARIDENRSLAGAAPPAKRAKKAVRKTAKKTAKKTGTKRSSPGRGKKPAARPARRGSGPRSRG